MDFRIPSAGAGLVPIQGNDKVRMGTMLCEFVVACTQVKPTHCLPIKS